MKVMMAKIKINNLIVYLLYIYIIFSFLIFIVILHYFYKESLFLLLHSLRYIYNYIIDEERNEIKREREFQNYEWERKKRINN